MNSKPPHNGLEIFVSPAVASADRQSRPATKFDALEVSFRLIESLRQPVAVLQKHDPDLVNQLRRAASSVCLNISEGQRRVGKDRLHLWRIAAGSADEVRASLRVAVAWGHLYSESVATSLSLVDRVVAMLWRLTHPKA